MTPGRTTPPNGRVELPRSSRHYRFSMIPMADVMFQLLIFFMLSANMAPYSLLTVRSGATLAPDVAAPVGSEPAGNRDIHRSDPLATAVWSVRADSIVANGQRFPLDRIPDLARALQQQGTPELLLIAQSGATVQNLVTILETLTGLGITSVRLADGAGT